MKSHVVKIRPSKQLSRSSSQGFTLIELVIVMVIVAIGVALAVPTWRSIVEKRQLTSAIEQVSSFLSYAQGEAVKRNEEVTLSWNSDGDDSVTWCIGASLGADVCACTQVDPDQSDYCEIDDIPLLLSQKDFVDITAEFMHMNPQTGSFSFDPIRGVITNVSGNDIFADELFLIHSNEGTESSREFAMQLQLNITGRIRICIDSISQRKAGGYPTC